jgi:transcriptional regulator with XRE-family HTH domain
MAAPSDRAGTLAANVRRLRDARGLTLQQLADRAGVAKTTLYKIEARRGNPTLDTLVALAAFFAVGLDELVGAGDERVVDVVRAGSGGVDISGTASRAALLRSMMIGGTLVEVVEAEIHPGLSETAVSHGAGAREHVLVRHGRVIAGPVGHEVELGPGDYATYPSDRPHRWSNRGDEDAAIWVVHTFPRGVEGPPAG